MRASTQEFWATTAQVMPVFALALVIEARTLSSRWGPATPRIWRSVHILLWAGILVMLGFGENASLQALSGESVAPWWPRVIRYAISSSVGLLILAPLVAIAVQSLAEQLSRAVTIEPSRKVKRVVRRFKRRLYARRIQRRRNEIHDLQRRGMQALDGRALGIGELDRLLRESLSDTSITSAGRSEADEALARIPEMRRRLNENRSEVAQANADYAAFEVASDEEWAQMDQQLADLCRRRSKTGQFRR